jgi:hypothetical protein
VALLTSCVSAKHGASTFNMKEKISFIIHGKIKNDYVVVEINPFHYIILVIYKYYINKEIIKPIRGS